MLWVSVGCGSFCITLWFINLAVFVQCSPVFDIVLLWSLLVYPLGCQSNREYKHQHERLQNTSHRPSERFVVSTWSKP